MHLYLFIAGAERLELPTHGFGDRYSTNWAIPLKYNAERLGSDPNPVKPNDLLSRQSRLLDSCSLQYWSTMSTNMRTRWTLLLCVCINQNTNGTFIVVSQLSANCDRFCTAKVACYSLSDNFMKYLLRNSVFPIFILTAYLYFADLVQTSFILV